MLARDAISFRRQKINNGGTRERAAADQDDVRSVWSARANRAEAAPDVDGQAGIIVASSENTLHAEAGAKGQQDRLGKPRRGLHAAAPRRPR